MPMKAPVASILLATGTNPAGKKVAYYESDRPGTASNQGGGLLILVCDAETGEKLTHSDSLAGLQKAGFKVDAAATPPADDPALPSEVEMPAQENARRGPKGKRFPGL